MTFKTLREDIDSIIARDPAARSRAEVVICYPGFQAILLHRLAHSAWIKGWRLSARFVSQVGRLLTGIEIHPGATVGRRVFIDHGMGVVIGETAIVGDDVTLYQGVTLGGTKLHKGKRHPTLERGVIVGSGAQILGPFTVGAEARIGANAVVLAEVPSGVTMTGIPAKPALTRDKSRAAEFQAYGTPTDGLPDPVARAIEALQAEVAQLRGRVVELEGSQTPVDARPPLRIAGT
ncbi:MAG: serine O-acetyltransferase [Alphaproteobacteria bacterium]|nr:serine O-acetyltransferase [Alphaproteobacteria bacterium]